MARLVAIETQTVLVPRSTGRLLGRTVLDFMSTPLAALLCACLGAVLRTQRSLLGPDGLDSFVDHPLDVQKLLEPLVPGTFIGFHLDGQLFLLLLWQLVLQLLDRQLALVAYFKIQTKHFFCALHLQYM